MKNFNVLLLFFALVATLSIQVKAQKVIENPQFSATTAGNVKITKIILFDTATVIDFEVTYKPHWWIHVSSEDTRITNSKGGEDLYVTRSEGIQLDTRHNTPKSGVNKYTLFFPPVEPGIETIDFLESQWKIFDIELVPQDKFSKIPEALKGNWLATNGSNQWVIGLYDDLAIYKNEFWPQVSIKQKGRNYELILENEQTREQLFIKEKKGKLILEANSGEDQKLSRQKTFVTGYQIPDDKEFKTPVFHSDTAIFKGYVKGYHPKMNATGMVYYNNVLTGNQSSHLVQFNQDGSFELKIAMVNPQSVYFRFLRNSETIFLEPGKTILTYIDFNDNSEQLFMGKNSLLNRELNAMKFIRYYDYSAMQKKILDMSYQDFRDEILSLLDREKESFYEFINSNQVSKKAQQIKLLELSFDSYTNILGYNMSRNSAYRSENNIPRDQREIDLEEEIPEDPAFYDFIDSKLINQETALLAGSDYYFVLNRIEFADVIRKNFSRPQLLLSDVLEQVDFSKELSKDEEELVKKIISCKNDITCLRDITATDSWKNFSEKYQSQISGTFSKIMTRTHNKKKKEALSKYFGITGGIIPDIFTVIDKSRQMEASFQPIEEEVLQEATSTIQHPFIKEYLISLNDAKKAEIAAKLAAIESKDGYVKNETPTSEADQIFDEIMKKYRGKLVYVDFWATWCGPCRSGIKRIKPLKEEMKDKDIEFVYITNHTSPENTYNLMIPDIAGEHYRVNEDQWNYLSSKFNITGIPHYVLVDQQGIVIQGKINLGMRNEDLKRLFEKHMLNN